MENNFGAIKFYEKQSAYKLHKTAYDLGNLLKDKSSLLEKTKPLTARQIVTPDSIVPSEIEPAISDPYAGIFSIHDNSGDPAALIVINANFSTFRTVTGLVTQPVIFLKPANENEKSKIFKAAFHAACDFASAKGYTGHL